MHENEISGIVIDSAFKVHSTLGPGLLESVYEKVLAYELRKRGLRVETQQPVVVRYDNIIFDEGFLLDLLVEEKVIVEIKSIEEIAPIHKKQLLTYLRLDDKRSGLLLNFNVELIKQGITRIACQRSRRVTVFSSETLRLRASARESFHRSPQTFL